MKRRVVKHGHSTHIISLPAKWTKRYGIRKGDELEVTEKGKSLIVSLGSDNRSRGITSDVTDLTPRLVDRFLARSYQKGYDVVNLIHNNLVLLKTVQDKVPELIGYEMVEQDNRSCTIRSISQNIELDFDHSLRKAFLIVKTMIESCCDAYINDDKKSLETLHFKDFEVNRHCYFCLRQINKEQFVEPEFAQQSHILYYLIESLEDLGDSVKVLAKELAKTTRVRKEFVQVLKMVVEQYAISYSYFYQATKKKANDAFHIYKEISKCVDDLAGSTLKKEEVLSLFHITDASHIIYHFTTMRLDSLKV